MGEALHGEPGVIGFAFEGERGRMQGEAWRNPPRLLVLPTEAAAHHGAFRVAFPLVRGTS